MELSSTTLRQIQDAQRTLLAPLRADSVDDWLQRVTGSVKRVMGADHAYAVFPETDGLRMETAGVDADFCDGLRNSIAGFEEGAFLFDDPMPLQMHLHRRRGGPGAYHELDMFDRPTIEASPLFQELFFPFGIRYAVGLSVPLAKGEAMICVGFDAPDADGYAREAKKRLEVLVPALESAVRQHRRLCRARTDFSRMIDRLATPVAFLGPEGEDEYCNRPLRNLLAAEPESGRLLSGIRSIVPSVGDEPPAVGAVSKTVDLAGGRYRLRLGRPPRSVGRGWLVLVDRLTLYPSPATLEASWGLTPREAEVALLLAKGTSNRDLAAALTISPHTARHHVQSVLDKLDVSSRSAVAHVLLREDRGAG